MSSPFSQWANGESTLGLECIDAAVLTCAADITPEPIQWIWMGWLAAGKLHIIAGAPGTGKTTIALAFASILTSGGRWPDGSYASPADVFVWSSEDDPTDTLTPRLYAMGANVSRVHFITAAKDGGHERAFDPATDIPQLETAIQLTGKRPKLLIVDPIVSAVAGDSNKNAETRRSLQPLVDLGNKYGCAILGVSHFSKGTGGREVTERITGSLAFGALARIVMAAVKSADGEGKRILARGKSNIGEDSGGYHYDLKQMDIPAFKGVSASCLLWGDAIEGSAREILANAEGPLSDEGGSAVEDAANWLADLLGNGPIPPNEIKVRGRQHGHSWASIRRAKDRLEIVSKKGAMDSGWAWALPEGAQENVKMSNKKCWASSDNVEHLRDEGDL